MGTRSRAPLWLVALLGGVAIALVPWTVLLNERLPSRHVTAHWNIVWTGFDLALSAVILATATAAVRGSEWLGRLAMVAGTMLCCDALFDILTSTTRTELVVALVEAALAELPLAVLCFVIARRPQRFAAASALRTVKSSERRPDLR